VSVVVQRACFTRDSRFWFCMNVSTEVMQGKCPRSTNYATSGSYPARSINSRVRDQSHPAVVK
jgi:hypothetical protein